MPKRVKDLATSGAKRGDPYLSFARFEEIVTDFAGERYLPVAFQKR